MTASDDEDSHEEEKNNPVLLRPSSVVKTEILTRNGSFKADTHDLN
jgi:hypothetical protein